MKVDISSEVILLVLVNSELINLLNSLSEDELLYLYEFAKGLFEIN